VGWRAIVRSAIGTRHQQEQRPCQDFGGDRTLGNLVIGAIADGAGSARYADMGAQIAVKTTLDYLAHLDEWLSQPQKHSWPSFHHPPSQSQVKRLFEKTTHRVVSNLQSQALSYGYAVDELACTLLAFAATPNWLAAMQIGDGFLVARFQPASYELLFRPDRGEFANQTTFVTAPNAIAQMQVRVFESCPQFVCAATDGLEHVALHLRSWTAHSPFFKPFEEYLIETSEPEQHDRYLVDFLASDRLNSRTDDDKTLLLCLLVPED
jgi:hypothetical protein